MNTAADRRYTSDLERQFAERRRYEQSKLICAVTGLSWRYIRDMPDAERESLCEIYLTWRTDTLENA